MFTNYSVYEKRLWRLKLRMIKSSVRKIITDTMWEKLGTAVAAAKHSRAGAPAEQSDREFLEAVLHLNRTGCPWRDLPARLGYWHAVYMRFRRWEERGVWQRLWKNLQAEPFAGARGLLLDSTTVRAPPHAAGAPKKTAATRLWAALAGAGARKSTPPPSTKTLAHLPASLVPSAASAVALHLTPGQAHDGRQFEALSESLDPDNVLEFAALDKGYDADRIRERLAGDGIEPAIPPLSSRCPKPPCDKERYRTRNRIERFFNKLKPFRRLATRYDKLAKTFFAALCEVDPVLRPELMEIKL